MLNRITIVGGGSWGTALVKIFTESGINVSWLVRNQEVSDYINANGSNPRYLSSVILNRSLISAVSEPAAAFRDSQLVIFAVPSAFLMHTVQAIEKELLEDLPLAVSIKGLAPGTGVVPGRVVEGYFARKENEVIVFGGPCHAEEIASQKTTYLTVSGTNTDLVKMICNSITCPYIIPVSSNDPSGIQYAFVLKNIIGIASGIASGLLYGENFQSVLISNAMKEAGQFIEAVEPGKRDLFQSAYFGDLLVTAYSDFSRNRTLGKLVGRGLHVNKAMQAMEMVAEGYHASRELGPTLSQSKLHLPVLQSVYRILHKQASPYREFKLLEEQFT